MLSGAGCFLSRLLCGSAARWDCPVESDSPRIYFSNHTSHLDFLKIFSSLPSQLRECTHPVAAEEYWQASAMRRFVCLRIFNAVLVPRKPSMHRRDILDPLYATLEKGDSLIFFPEGTRSVDGRLHRFRKGLYRLWKKFPQAELVPVYLENLNRILPKGEFLPVPLVASVVFGEVFKPPPEMSAPEFQTAARRCVIDLSDGRLADMDD